MSYPLNPLSADVFTAVAAMLQREHGVDADWRHHITRTDPCHTASTSAGH